MADSNHGPEDLNAASAPAEGEEQLDVAGPPPADAPAAEGEAEVVAEDGAGAVAVAGEGDDAAAEGWAPADADEEEAEDDVDVVAEEPDVDAQAETEVAVARDAAAAAEEEKVEEEEEEEEADVVVEDGGVDADAEAAAAAAAAEGEEGDPDGEEAEGAVEGGDLDILDAALSGDHDRLVSILQNDKGAVKARNEEGQTALHLVVKDCYVVCCKQLIKAGAELDAQDSAGQTPLHWAIYYGSLDIIDALLESGASPMICDNEGMNALHMSAQMGLYRVAEVLLMDMNFEDEGEKEDEGELCPKCWHKATLISPDQDVDHRPACDHPFHLTEKRDQSKRLPVDKVALLRQQDKDGNTPLHLTAGEPDYRSMALEFCSVLREEAPEEVVDIISIRNNANLQPLHLAAAAGNTEVIGELLEIGADPDARTDEGENCFHLAVISGVFPSVWQILERRVPMGDAWVDFLNAVDGKGNDVMHLACKHGNDRAAIEFLRHRKALDINAKNNYGDTPAVIAYKEGFDYLLRVLLANGASEDEVLAAKAEDEAKGIVRQIKNDPCGLGPAAVPQGVSYTPLVCLVVLMIFIGPYFFSFLERFL